MELCEPVSPGCAIFAQYSRAVILGVTSNPTLCSHSRGQGHLPLSQLAPSPVRAGFGHLQGWARCLSWLFLALTRLSMPCRHPGVPHHHGHCDLPGVPLRRVPRLHLHHSRRLQGGSQPLPRPLRGLEGSWGMSPTSASQGKGMAAPTAEQSRGPQEGMDSLRPQQREGAAVRMCWHCPGHPAPAAPSSQSLLLLFPLAQPVLARELPPLAWEELLVFKFFYTCGDPRGTAGPWHRAGAGGEPPCPSRAP